MDSSQPPAGRLYRCPLCRREAQLLTIPEAAQIAHLSTKTIYRYITAGLLHSVRVVGKRRRVCSGCLFSEHTDSSVSDY